MPILFGILIGALITAVVVMISIVFAAKSYKPFSKIMDRLIDWAERFESWRGKEIGTLKSLAKSAA